MNEFAAFRILRVIAYSAVVLIIASGVKSCRTASEIGKYADIAAEMETRAVLVLLAYVAVLPWLYCFFLLQDQGDEVTRRNDD